MNAIRRGFVTQLGMGYEEAFEHADRFGLDYVELMMDGPHERSALDGETDQVRALADERGLDLAVHLPFRLDIASPFEHVREGALRELLAAIETATACGAEKGVVHASTDAWPPAWEYDPLREHLLSSLRDERRCSRSGSCSHAGGHASVLAWSTPFSAPHSLAVSIAARSSRSAPSRTC